MKQNVMSVSRKRKEDDEMTTRIKEMGGEGNWETGTREVCLCKFVLLSWKMGKKT
jgi:hypothetical protein